MDVEKVREEFGHEGKSKQWQIGFDALLKYMPDYIKAQKAPVAESPAAMYGYACLLPKVAQIYSKRVQRIIADIGHLINRKDCAMAEDEFSKAIDHLKNGIERIQS